MSQCTRFNPDRLTRSSTALEEEFSAPMPTMPPASTMHPLVASTGRRIPGRGRTPLGTRRTVWRV
ncbi:hypothetical protein DPMN_126756 [Dreissena polymorpha]|uniref:Uncharacterized protein n=1 Tax=Dreissena polymorpha TaxID=45954 RepID=A0A9D4JYG3_DREPO|nr:hypothetical protein DPMN_126756 [Dreissena polymorpha]